MTTLLLRLDQSVDEIRDIADSEKLLNIMRNLRLGEAKVENFENGKTHSVAIEGSTVDYTLSLNSDGTGMIQRTMSSPGSQHITVSPRERESVLTLVSLEKGGQQAEIHLLTVEPFALPVVVGTPDGFRLRGIFLYDPK